MNDTGKQSYSDKMEQRVQGNKFRVGLLLLWFFGAYLGLTGLQLVIGESNFIAGVPLIITALLILPPPAGISNYLESNYGITMGQRIGVSIILLFITYVSLTYF